MAYYVHPQGSPSHTVTLEARLDSVMSFPYIPGGMTIEWRQNGAPIPGKSGSTDDLSLHRINTGDPGDYAFDATDTGSVIDFVIDGTTYSNPVTLSNQQPTLPVAAISTDAYGRISGYPTVSWTFSDADGDPQFQYRVRLGTGVGLGDIYDTGIVYAEDDSFALPDTEPDIAAGTAVYWTLDVSDGEKTVPTDPDSTTDRVLVSASGNSIVNTPPVASAVKVNGLSGAPTVSSFSPTFSWSYSDTDGQPQQSFRILVSESVGLTDPVWDSGDISGAQTSSVYNFNGIGAVLSSHVTYYVGVQVSDTLEFSAFATESFVISVQPEVSSVFVNDRINPTNLRPGTVVFTWQVDHTDGDPVTAYEIRVADNQVDLGTDSFIGNIWHPGVAVTSEAFETEMSAGSGAFPGCVFPKSLQSGTEYCFQVQVHDAYSKSEWYTGCFKLNDAPVASNPRIVPEFPFTSDDLEAVYDYSDDEGEDEATEIFWYRNGQEISSLRGQRIVPASVTRPFEEWSFSVRPYDGVDFGTLVTSDSVTISDRAPSVLRPAISPSAPKTGNALEATFDISDADGDSIEVRISWFKNGQEQTHLRNLTTVPPNEVRAGDTWFFEAIPSDGYLQGTIGISAPVEVENTKPEILSLLVDGEAAPDSVDNANPVFSWTFFDIDGQRQGAYRVLVGTTPLRTRRSSGSAPTDLLCGDKQDGIISTSEDAEIISGNDVFDSGTVESPAQAFQYATEDFFPVTTMAAPDAVSFNGYVVASDVSTMRLQTGQTVGSIGFDFTGIDGTYETEISYSGDGFVSSFELIIGGQAVDKFDSSTTEGTHTYKFRAARIESGERVEIRGSALESGAKAAFSRLSFVPVTEFIRAADDFDTLAGYTTDGNGGIRLVGLAGSATLVFPFPSGQYDMEVQYITESSGTPSMSVSLNASVVDSWVFETGVRTRSRFITGLDVATGDRIKISGSRGGGASARIKEVIFRPIQTFQQGSKLRDGLRYFASVKVFDGQAWSDWYTTEFFMSGSAWISSVSNADGWTLEAKFRIVENESAQTAEASASCDKDSFQGIRFYDGTSFGWLRLKKDKVELLVDEPLEYAVDGTELHTYRIVVIGKDIKLYVDSELAIDGSGHFVEPTNRKVLEFGDIAGRQQTSGSEWESFKYSVSGAFPPNSLVDYSLEEVQRFADSSVGRMKAYGDMLYVSVDPIDTSLSSKIYRYEEGYSPEPRSVLALNRSLVTSVVVDPNRKSNLFDTSGKFIGTHRGLQYVLGSKPFPFDQATFMNSQPQDNGWTLESTCSGTCSSLSNGILKIDTTGEVGERFYKLTQRNPDDVWVSGASNSVGWTLEARVKIADDGAGGFSVSSNSSYVLGREDDCDPAQASIAGFRTTDIPDEDGLNAPGILVNDGTYQEVIQFFSSGIRLKYAKLFGAHSLTDQFYTIRVIAKNKGIAVYIKGDTDRFFKRIIYAPDALFVLTHPVGDQELPHVAIDGLGVMHAVFQDSRSGQWAAYYSKTIPQTVVARGSGMYSSSFVDFDKFVRSRPGFGLPADDLSNTLLTENSLFSGGASFRSWGVVAGDVLFVFSQNRGESPRKLVVTEVPHETLVKVQTNEDLSEEYNGAEFVVLRGDEVWLPPVQVSTQSFESNNPRILIASDVTTFVAYDNNEGGGRDIYVRRGLFDPFYSSWQESVRVTNATGDAVLPDIAQMSNGDLVIVWQDSRVDPTGSHIFGAKIPLATFGTEQAIQNIDLTADLSIAKRPRVSIQGEDVIVAFESVEDGESKVVVLSLDKNLQRRSITTLADGSEGRSHRNVAVASNGTSAVVIWESEADSVSEIMAATGEKPGEDPTEFGSGILITDSVGQSLFPSVVMDDAGTISVAFQDDRVRGGYPELYLSTYDRSVGEWISSGQRGLDMRIESYLTESGRPSLVIDSFGNKAIAFEAARDGKLKRIARIFVNGVQTSDNTVSGYFPLDDNADDGVVQNKIRSLRGSVTPPVQLVMLVSRQQDMAVGNRFPDAQTVSNGMVQASLRSGDEFNVFFFNTERDKFQTDLVSSFDSNKSSAQSFISSQSVLGLPDMASAIEDALDQSFTPGDSRTKIIAIVDAGVTGGTIETRSLGASTCDSETILGTAVAIAGSTDTLFNGGADFPAGTYCVEYVSGSIDQFSSDPTSGWGVGLSAPNEGVISNGEIIEGIPFLFDFSSAAAAEAAMLARSDKGLAFIHLGGPIGVRMEADADSDNSGSMTFRLCQLEDTAIPPGPLADALERASDLGVQIMAFGVEGADESVLAAVASSADLLTMRDDFSSISLAFEDFASKFDDLRENTGSNTFGFSPQVNGTSSSNTNLLHSDSLGSGLSLYNPANQGAFDLNENGKVFRIDSSLLSPTGAIDVWLKPHWPSDDISSHVIWGNAAPDTTTPNTMVFGVRPAFAGNDLFLRVVDGAGLVREVFSNNNGSPRNFDWDIDETVHLRAVWDQNAVGVSTIRSLSFPSALVGFATTESGAIWKTEDGGVTWASLPTGVTYELYSVDFVDTLNGWACGELGTVLKTGDGGGTWTAIDAGVDEDLNGIFFRTSSIGYAVGSNGTILRSTDGGDTWSSATVDATDDFRDVALAGLGASYAVIAVGANNAIYRSTDDGVTYDRVTGLPASAGWNAISRAHRTGAFPAYVVGNGGKIMKSGFDGGLTWQDVSFDWTIGYQPNLYGVAAAASGSSAFVVGQGGSFAQTSDGQTFTEKETAVRDGNLRAVEAFFGGSGNGQQVVAAGVGGTVMLSDSAGDVQTYAITRSGNLKIYVNGIMPAQTILNDGPFEWDPTSIDSGLFFGDYQDAGTNGANAVFDEVVVYKAPPPVGALYRRRDFSIYQGSDVNLLTENESEKRIEWGDISPLVRSKSYWTSFKMFLCGAREPLQVFAWDSQLGLVDDVIRAMELDNSGRMWIATEHGITSFDIESANDDIERWMSGKPLLSGPKNRFINYTNMVDGLVADDVSCLAVDADDNLWAGTNSGLMLLAISESSYVESSEDPVDVQRQIYDTTKDFGTPGAGTFGSGDVVNAAPIKFSSYNTESGLPSNSILSLKFIGDALFVGTDKGLAVIDLSSGTSLDKMSIFTVKDGLPSNRITSIASEKRSGDVWIGTDRGLARFSASGSISYDASNGLLNNDIFSILVDDEDRKFVGTGFGITRIDGTEFSSFRPTDGVGFGAILDSDVDGSGIKWFATSSGLVSMDDVCSDPAVNFVTLDVSDGILGQFGVTDYQRYMILGGDLPTGACEKALVSVAVNGRLLSSGYRVDRCSSTIIFDEPLKASDKVDVCVDRGWRKSHDFNFDPRNPDSQASVETSLSRLRLYRKRFEAGTVVLGANFSRGAANRSTAMYAVFVVPLSGSGTPVSSVQQPASAVLVDEAANDVSIYSDETDEIQVLPAELVGAQMITLPSADAQKTEEEYLEFVVSSASFVYVAYDARSSSLPGWLRSYQPVPAVFRVTDLDTFVDATSAEKLFMSVRGTAGCVFDLLRDDNLCDISGQIALDAQAPTGCAKIVRVNGTSSLVLSLQASDSVTGVADMQVSAFENFTSNGEDALPFIPFQPTYTLSLPVEAIDPVVTIEDSAPPDDNPLDSNSLADIQYTTVFQQGTRIFLGTSNPGRVYEYLPATQQVVFRFDTGEDEVLSMIGFGSDLIVGTGPNGRAFRWNGTTLTQILLPTNDSIESLIAFDNRVFFGTSPEGKIFQMDDAGVVSLFLDTFETSVTSFAIYAGQLYWSTLNDSVQEGDVLNLTTTYGHRHTVAVQAGADRISEVSGTTSEVDGHTHPVSAGVAAVSDGHTHILNGARSGKVFRLDLSTSLSQIIHSDRDFEVTDLVSTSVENEGLMFLGTYPNGKIMRFVPEEGIFIKSFDTVKDRISRLRLINGVVYAVADDDIYFFDGKRWQFFGSVAENILDIIGVGSDILVVRADSLGIVQQIQSDGSVQSQDLCAYVRFRDAAGNVSEVRDSSGNLVECYRPCTTQGGTTGGGTGTGTDTGTGGTSGGASDPNNDGVADNPLLTGAHRIVEVDQDARSIFVLEGSEPFLSGIRIDEEIGRYYSEVFNGTNSLVQWTSLSWVGTTPAGTSITIAVRSANTAAEIPDAEFGEEFTSPTGNDLTNLAGQFLQFRATLKATVMGAASPSLDKVDIELRTSQAVHYFTTNFSLPDNLKKGILTYNGCINPPVTDVVFGVSGKDSVDFSDYFVISPNKVFNVPTEHQTKDLRVGIKLISSPDSVPVVDEFALLFELANDAFIRLNIDGQPTGNDGAPITSGTTTTVVTEQVQGHTHTVTFDSTITDINGINGTTSINAGHSHLVVNGVIQQSAGHTHTFEI